MGRSPEARKYGTKGRGKGKTRGESTGTASNGASIGCNFFSFPLPPSSFFFAPREEEHFEVSFFPSNWKRVPIDERETSQSRREDMRRGKQELLRDCVYSTEMTAEVLWFVGKSTFQQDWGEGIYKIERRLAVLERASR